MRSRVHPESPFFSMDMSSLVLPVYCPRKLRGGGPFVQRLLVLRCNWTAFRIFQELGMVPNFGDTSDNRIYPPHPSCAHCSAKRSELAPCSACPLSQSGRNTSHGQEASGCYYCVSTGAPVVPRLASRPALGRCGRSSHPRW